MLLSSVCCEMLLAKCLEKIRTNISLSFNHRYYSTIWGGNRTVKVDRRRLYACAIDRSSAPSTKRLLSCQPFLSCTCYTRYLLSYPILLLVCYSYCSCSRVAHRTERVQSTVGRRFVPDAPPPPAVSPRLLAVVEGERGWGREGAMLTCSIFSSYPLFGLDWGRQKD